MPTKAKNFLTEAQSAALTKMGGRATTVAAFLREPHAETAVSELICRLRTALRTERQDQGVTQSELAARLGIKQQNVARMETAGSGTTADALIESLIELGASMLDIASIVAGRELQPKARTAVVVHSPME